MTSDARAVLAAQGLRAFAYGLTSVLLGVSLDRLGFSGLQAGAVLTAVVAGAIFASLAVARYSPRYGRRRCYLALYVLLALNGIAFAFVTSPWALAFVALSGALSTEVVESGPFTSLEQAMLAEELSVPELAKGFGLYNAVATASGSIGALAAGLTGWAYTHHGVPEQRWFLLLVAAAAGGVLLTMRLSPHVEVPPGEDAGGDDAPAPPRQALDRSRPVVVRLSGLFAMDSFGGGFVVQSFIAFWFAQRFDASVGAIGVVFFVVGILQTISFLLAPLLARRFGLLATMVGTHLPSNVLLMAMAFSPTFAVAVALLFARVALSQMDVPTRQAYVMSLVEPNERVAAAAYTNTARYVVRPLGPTLAGAAQSIALGAPFVIAGSIKGAYDLVLWRWFSGVELRAR